MADRLRGAAPSKDFTPHRVGEYDPTRPIQTVGWPLIASRGNQTRALEDFRFAAICESQPGRDCVYHLKVVYSELKSD